MNKKINIFVTAGGRYLQWFRSYGYPSLKQDIDRLNDDGWQIEMVYNGFSSMTDPQEIKTTSNRSASEIKNIMSNGLISVIEKSILEDCFCFFAAPDLIFSKDTFYNVIKIAENKKYDVAIAIPHMRIKNNDKIPNKYPITSPQLVDLAISIQHDTFKNCFDDKEVNYTYMGGLHVRKINDKLHVLSSNLPTMCLIKFNESDLEFWKENDIISWDREFLGKIYNENRLKVIGSSDIGFYVEITEPPSSMQLLPNQLYNDYYFKKDLFYTNLGNIIFSMRGE